MIAITQRQYYIDQWQRELTTEVVLQTKRDHHYLVVLAETIFYPTGGGQPHDLGFLNGEPLLAVFEEGDTIYHMLKNPLNTTTVKCSLAWGRRFDHMQQHTGQHLLSAVFAREYGYETASFHLGEDYCTIDIKTPDLPLSEQKEAENLVNEYIYQALPIHTYTVPQTEISSLPLRKIPEVAGDLRIVEIAGYDYSPCSGTHLATTSQLGLLKILKQERQKGLTRVYFLAGKRALEDYHRKHLLGSELVGIFSVPEGELLARIKQELDKKRDGERMLKEMQAELYNLKAELITAKQGSPYLIKLEGETIAEAQLLTRAILAKSSNSFVAVGLEHQLVLAHNLTRPFNLGQLVKQLAPTFAGRGGGGPFAAQVYFPDPQQLDKFQKSIIKHLESDI